MTNTINLLFSILLLTMASALNASPANKSSTLVEIENGWVRATHAGQSVGAAYMNLTSPQDSALVYAESDSAGSVEIHSMSMTNGVMKMRMLEALPLAANKPAKLAPGGLHLMLFDLKKPLKVGDKVTFTLCFKDSKNHITHQDITLPIKEGN